MIVTVKGLLALNQRYKLTMQIAGVLLIIIFLVSLNTSYTEPQNDANPQNQLSDNTEIKKTFDNDPHLKVQQFQNPDYLEPIYALNFNPQGDQSESNGIFSHTPMAISPDGRLLAYIEDTHNENLFIDQVFIQLWDIPSGRLYKTIPFFGGFIKSIDFSPSGHLLAIASLRLVIFDINQDSVIQSFPSPKDSFKAVDFSPDGAIVVAGNDYGLIKGWNVGTGQEILVFHNQTDEERRPIVDLQISPDGKNLGVHSPSQPELRLYNMSTGELLDTVNKDGGALQKSLMFSQDSSEIYVVHSRTIEVGSFECCDVPEILRFSISESGLLTLHSSNTLFNGDVSSTDSITSIAFSPDGGTVATGMRNARLNLWDLQSTSNNHTLTDQNGIISASIFSPDGTLLISASPEDQTILIRNVVSHSLIHSLGVFRTRPNALAFSPDDKILASGSTNDLTTLWDVPSGSFIRSLPGNNGTFSGEISDVAFSPNGSLLVIASVGFTLYGWYGDGPRYSVIRFWDTTSWELRDEIFYPDSWRHPISLSFSPDSTILASGHCDYDGTGTVKIIDLNSGNELHNLTAGTDCVTSLDFSSDGTLLASGHGSLDDSSSFEAGQGAGRIQFWNTSNWTPIQPIDVPNFVASVDFSPDGKFLASAETGFGEAGAVRLFNTSTQDLIAVLDDQYPRQSVDFSPDGTVLASSAGKYLRDCEESRGGSCQVSFPGHISLWNLSTNTLIQNVTINHRPVGPIAFSHQGRVLAGGIVDDQPGLVQLWEAENLPIVIDQDGDGMETSWEVTHGLDPENFWDKFADSDNDSLINSMEYLLGTNPQSFDSNGNHRSDAEDAGWLLLIQYPDEPGAVASSPSDLGAIMLLIGILISGASFFLLGASYIVRRRRDRLGLLPVPFAILNQSMEFSELKSLFHKVVVGLETAKQHWLTKYPEDELDYLITAETEGYSMATDIFPSEIQTELKSELRGRTVTILIELAYQYPQNAHASFIAKTLNIPHPTVTVEIKKLQLLQYIQLVITPDSLQDSRFKFYSLTPKGVVFLHLLKESISLSLAHIKVNGQ